MFLCRNNGPVSMRLVCTVRRLSVPSRPGVAHRLISRTRQVARDWFQTDAASTVRTQGYFGLKALVRYGANGDASLHAIAVIRGDADRCG